MDSFFPLGPEKLQFKAVKNALGFSFSAPVDTGVVFNQPTLRRAEASFGVFWMGLFQKKWGGW